MRGVMPWFLVFSTVLSTSPALLAQCNQNCPERRTISVNGTATVTADADLAIVRVGYKLYGPDAQTVYTSATSASNAVMQALTASGVPKAAIESTSQVIQHTDGYDIQQFPYDSTQHAQHEFTVRQSWAIRIKPDDAARTLDTAIRAGANESGWIEWIVEHPESLQAEVAAKAEANARSTAERIAQNSGFHLGHVVSVNENQGAPGSPGGYGGGYGGGIATLRLEVPGNQPLQINSRRVQFQASVYVVYAIE